MSEIYAQIKSATVDSPVIASADVEQIRDVCRRHWSSIADDIQAGTRLWIAQDNCLMVIHPHIEGIPDRATWTDGNDCISGSWRDSVLHGDGDITINASGQKRHPAQKIEF
ncbi:hypothetical protein [Reyranella sp.]|uniref:hypothetical protein n=1 Tax=Reyranella sp. TaxID=1929291 RepID=UPI0027319941|nr:hypothetical protein [Reyranella sp.]MDP2374272.1 hypothetical protein [Reyranella sp.]